MPEEKKKKSKLNVNIDPALLLSLQSEAIKEGKTLTEFVTEKLKQSPIETSRDLHSLEARILTIEKLLGLDKKPLKKKIIWPLFLLMKEQRTMVKLLRQSLNHKLRRRDLLSKRD